MPVSRRTAEGLSAEVAQVYARAEVRLLRLIARHLEAGHGTPGWVDVKLAELQVFRKRAERIVGAATTEAKTAAGHALVTAYNRGQGAAEGELVNLGRDTIDLSPRRAEYAVEALTRAQADVLDAVGPRVVRGSQDAYRDAVVRAAGGTLTGAATRREDAQVALDDLARKGLSGFTDARGRQWGLESYVDMATRTTTAQAAVQGHMDRLEDGGLSLFIVSESSRECELCRPWEGKVLTRGPVDAMATNVLTGEVERVQIDGTVAEATAAGLFHPNCTHNLSGYVHGATRRGRAVGNAEGYAEKQRQRAMERNLREWKRREAVAITPDAARKAKAKVAEWQQALAAHTQTTGLPRKYDREAFDLLRRTAPGDARALAGDLAGMDVELIDAEMADLMAANDYGARFEQLAGELDRRDAEAATKVLHTVPVTPDPLAERAVLHDMLDPFAALDRVTEADKIADAVRWAASDRPKRSLEDELRDEYDTWTHTQWLRAEEDTRGNMLTREARARGVSEHDLFTGRMSLKWATPELQEWFSLPGNQRMSFPEFRAGRMTDKKAREAERRRRNRGFESEYG